MSVKTTFSNGRTMTAGFYNGLRLTNRQAQYAEMMRNGLTVTDCADSFGIGVMTVNSSLHMAAVANGLSGMRELRERLDLPPAGRRKAAAHFQLRDAVKDAVKATVKAPEAEKIGQAIVRKGWTLTQDQVTLQLALRFNGDIHNAAKWLDWTEKECLVHIVEACRKQDVQPTLENFLKIV